MRTGLPSSLMNARVWSRQTPDWFLLRQAVTHMTDERLLTSRGFFVKNVNESERKWGKKQSAPNSVVEKPLDVSFILAAISFFSLGKLLRYITPNWHSCQQDITFPPLYFSHWLLKKGRSHWRQFEVFRFQREWQFEATWATGPLPAQKAEFIFMQNTQQRHVIPSWHAVE